MRDFLIHEYESNTGKEAFVPIGNTGGRAYMQHFVEYLADRELNVEAIGKLGLQPGDILVAKMPLNAKDSDYQTVGDSIAPLFKENQFILVPSTVRFESLSEEMLAKIGLQKKVII